ncbi:MAG: hypothetical protein AAF821_14845 [Cyanobacteria bacterium P01_D01_bin.156]
MARNSRTPADTPPGYLTNTKQNCYNVGVKIPTPSMDPLTIAVAAATVVLTKVLEKTGETMGEQAMEQGGKLLDMLRRKSPDTVAKLEQAVNQKSLPENSDIIDAEIIEEVEKIAQEDSEVKASVEAVADAASSAGVVNAGKLADKIGILNQGRIDTVNLNL